MATGDGEARSGAGGIVGQLRHGGVDERACLYSARQLSSGQVGVMYR